MLVARCRRSSILLHIFQIPPYLRLELVEWIALRLVGCIVAGRANSSELKSRGAGSSGLPIGLLHEGLQVTQVVFEPVRRRLLQVDAHIFQGSALKFGEL